MRVCSIFILLASFGSGCSMFESSTYENRNTKDGNVVIATGKAAEGAASANTSHTCPTCAPSNGSAAGSVSTSNQPRTRTQESTDRIVTGAGDTLTNEISQSVNQAIRDVFDK